MTLDDAMKLHQAGRLPQAEAAYRLVLRQAPGDAQACHLLGMALHQLGKDREALDLVRRSVEMAPRKAEFGNNYAGLLGGAGRHEEAAAVLREALRLRPHFPEAHNNLGIALQRCGKVGEALGCFRTAIAQKSGYAEAYSNAGAALRQVGELDEAERHYRRAMELRPGFAAAQNGLAAVYAGMGGPERTAECLRKAMELQPDSAAAHSDWLLALLYPAGVPKARLIDEARRWEQRHASGHRAGPGSHDNDPAPDRRLRVGYVSVDFYEHPVARLMLPVLRCHDRSACETFCYSGGRGYRRPGRRFDPMRSLVRYCWRIGGPLWPTHALRDLAMNSSISLPVPRHQGQSTGLPAGPSGSLSA